jgi:hypothetical protein
MDLLITAFFIIYGMMQIPAGMFSDIFGPRKTYLASRATVLRWPYRLDGELVRLKHGNHSHFHHHDGEDGLPHKGSLWWPQED